MAIGCLFAPIAGVLIADYVVVKRRRIDVFVAITRLLVPRVEWARVAAERISVPAQGSPAETTRAALQP